MKLTAVVTCHERHDNLRHILTNLASQTRPPDETLVYVSGIPTGQIENIMAAFPACHLILVPDEQDWGHGKRARGLTLADGDVIGWFNDDDAYHPDYTQTLLAEIAEGADVAYCNWSYSPTSCQFTLGSSTSGNFLIRTALARRVGWRSRVYEADGHFIDRVRQAGARIVHVERVLYRHNVR